MNRIVTGASPITFISLVQDRSGSLEGRFFDRIERHLNSTVCFAGEDGANGKSGFAFGNQKEFEEQVATVASQMMSARTKSIKKEILDEVKANFTEFAKQIAPQFDEIKSVLGQKRDKKGGVAKDGGGDEGDELGPQGNSALRTMQKQIEELTNSNKRLVQDKETAEKRQQAMAVKNRLREVLEANGVTDPVKVRSAMAILISEDKKVAWSDSLQDAAGIDVDGAPIELETFVRGWSKSEEGEHFVEPRGAAGAGTRPTRRGQPAEQPRQVSGAELGLALLGMAQANPNGLLPGSGGQ